MMSTWMQNKLGIATHEDRQQISWTPQQNWKTKISLLKRDENKIKFEIKIMVPTQRSQLDHRRPRE